MNIASALIKQVLTLHDSETWSQLRKHYLPSEYHKLWTQITSHCDKYHKLPSFEDLTFEIRDSATIEKVLAISSMEVEAEPTMLLQYLKDVTLARTVT